MVPISHLFFKRFERVIDDGAVTSAIHELPHAARDRSISADDVRKALARIGTCFVNRALVAGKEHAALGVGAAQNPAFIFALGGVLSQEARLGNAQECGKVLDVTFLSRLPSPRGNN